MLIHSHSNGLSRSRSIIGRSKQTKRKSKSSLSSHEAFFIAHHKAQQAALNDEMYCDDSSPRSPVTPTLNNHIDLRKRVIFVSLMGLYQSWKTVPSTILFSSIFLLPLKKEWIYSSEKYHYQHDFEHVLNGMLLRLNIVFSMNNISMDINRLLSIKSLYTDTNFVKLLKWKDAQGLVFWMRDGITTSELQDCTMSSIPNYNVINNVAPFWKYLSYKLSLLYDPMTGQNYNPLKLDYKWWQNRFTQSNGFDEESSLHFNASFDGIRKELYLLTMKFKTMSEILYQSNQTLDIVTMYTLNVDNDNNGCSVVSRTKEASQKSYTSLPDHVLSEMAEIGYDHSNDNMTIDVNAPCSVDQLDLNGEITPNPNDEQTEDHHNNEDDNDNIWWVSPEYDEVMEIHDDDQLYQQYDDDDDNDNPLLTPRLKEEKDSVLIITDRVTI